MRIPQRLAAVTLIGGLTTLGIGLTAGAAGANVINDCTGYLGSAQSGSLHVTGTPAAGSSVTPGSVITLDSSWGATDFEEIGKQSVCGSIDGVFSPALSSQQKDIDPDGSEASTVTVPADVPAGSHICLLTALYGNQGSAGQATMTSETLCYTAAEAVTTTTQAPTTTTDTPAADPVDTNAGTNTAPAVEAAPVVQGEVAEAPAPLPVLPRTGSGVDRLAGFGAIVLGAGVLARLLGRKRSSAEA